MKEREGYFSFATCYCRYNGHTADDFCLQRTAAFVHQTDRHLGNISVYETLDLAHACLASDDLFNYPLELVKAR